MGEDMPYIYHITGCVSAILPGAAEYIMTGQLTPFIAGGVGVAGGLLTYAILTWWHKRKAGVAPSRRRDTEKTVLPPLIQRSLLDRLVVLRNPGNHEAVIRLIAKSVSVGDIDALFSNYINSDSHHPAYEGEVAILHYLKKCQLLKKGDERDKWYMGERYKIMRRYKWSMDQFTKEMSDTWEKYPELLEWDESD